MLGEEWRAIALDYQEKVHRVAIIILKAIFIGLGRDEKIIDKVRPLTGGTECCYGFIRLQDTKQNLQCKGVK